MCGRYTLTKDEKKIAAQLGVSERLGFKPRYNIAPTQGAPVIYFQEKPRLEEFRWGLIPFWSKDESGGSRMINARAESAAQKPAFRNALRKRRCLVLADGFYEWMKLGPVKAPLRIVLKDREPFAFAGLWESWRKPDGNELRTFTILTTQANDLIGRFHDRMPVILNEKDYEPWLDAKAATAEAVMNLLAPCSSEKLECYRVSPLVNNARNDTAQCIEPLPDLFA